ncbi:hypothetical protein AMTR_s00269p00006590 [Amborella trichopoda]|uniref:Uncharacterized protein n=1 Tax=Amborella trichopoda TaxID=13333 RepID=W1PFK1_AMBTC|nr:hypothetical protein AMTR_s00269p00006590 [Amborella trichopoda]
MLELYALLLPIEYLLGSLPSSSQHVFFAFRAETMSVNNFNLLSPALRVDSSSYPATGASPGTGDRGVSDLWIVPDDS